MSSPRALLLGAFLLSLGCIREYHPEYSPKTVVSYVQNVSYLESRACPTRSPATRPESPRPSPSLAAAPPRLAGDRFGEAPGPAAGVAPPPVPPPAEVDTPAHRRPDEARIALAVADDGARAAPSVLDLAAERVRCLAGHAQSCQRLPGIHLNGNVRIYGNVAMFGDVFLNDAVAESAPQEGP